MGQKHSAESLGNRPIEFPLGLTAEAKIYGLQAVPRRHMGTMEVTGRVFQLDYNKTVVGWVDSNGNAFRNDFNRMKVGHVDLNTRVIYQADYDKSVIGRVDAEGLIYLCSPGVHKSLESEAIGKIEGPDDSFVFAACAFLLLL